VHGSKGKLVLNLALDTGASRSVVSKEALEIIGFDVSAELDTVVVTMGSGTLSVPLVRIVQLDALECSKQDFSVLAHTLPSSSDVDGVLGLDFLRGHRLTIDFLQNLITLE
jgi:predicted aspartyl protease